MPVKEHRANDYLKTPEDIAAFLNAVIEEFDADPRLLMKAFRNVAAAQGGVSELARRAAVDRVGLCRGLSGNRNPRLGTVTKIAAACGVKIQFVARPDIGQAADLENASADASLFRTAFGRSGRVEVGGPKCRTSGVILSCLATTP